MLIGSNLQLTGVKSTPLKRRFKTEKSGRAKTWKRKDLRNFVFFACWSADGAAPGWITFSTIALYYRRAQKKGRWYNDGWAANSQKPLSVDCCTGRQQAHTQ